ncbi:MAG TPA: LytR C-terminal domain-containing protein [Solirubrobacteraceae bacterium]|nr:LytR C-terminal domain-containing protein [Solirubrobacteraceae bacterium]
MPFASLSIHSLVTSVGAYVGLGSLLAVAILILLYFGQARETATLRNRLDESQQRIAGLEARIAQLLQRPGPQRPRGAAPVAPPPVAPPVPVRSPGAPQGSVRRVPNPATAAAVATAGPAAGEMPAASRRSPVAVPYAPAGVAGPALASATRSLPVSAETGAPDDTLFVPAAAVNGRAEPTAPLTPAPAPVAASTAAAPASVTPAVALAATPAAGASPRATPPRPPRVRIGEEPEAPAAASGGGSVRRIGGRPEPAAASLPAFDFDDDSVGGGRFSGVLLPLVIGAVAVIVIIAGLVIITNNGSSTTGNVAQGNNGTTGQALHSRKTAPRPFVPARVTVAVLNGTAQAGLAGAVGKKLAAAGYREGNITNAASQTQSFTVVYYRTGARITAANRLAAEHVARNLTLPRSRVRPARGVVLQSCAISAAGASLGSCRANVIVSVGQDRVNLASG